jgi:hypothetical protein
LVFLILDSDERTLGAVALAAVDFDSPVRPAVTFLMALMPEALVAAGLGVAATGAGRTGAAAGICMVNWVEVFMLMTSRRFTSS